MADRAARGSPTAGRRAIDRLDDRTASALLTRAAELVRPHRLDLALELEAAWTLRRLDARRSAKAAEAAAERAEAAGDRSGAMLARALALFMRTASGEHHATDEQEELCRAALPFEEERGDPRRLALLWELLALIANFRMQNDEAVDRLRAGSPLPPPRRRLALGHADRVGADPRPAPGRRSDADARRARRLAAPGSRRPPRAALLAMLGRIDEAWPLAEARSSHLREVSGNSSQDGHCYLWLIAMIEGDRRARMPAQRRDDRHRWGRQRRRGVHGRCSRATSATSAASTRRSLCSGRLRPSRRRASSSGDGPAVEALLLAERGEFEQAEALARTAVAAAETETDNVWFQGCTYEDLATVLERAGRVDDAREALERALALWERKRCLPCAHRVRDQIASLDATAT